MASPVMQSPHRTVSSSVAMLRRHGYSRPAALHLIVTVCDRVLDRPDMQSGGDRNWADDVRAEAIIRLSHDRAGTPPGGKARADTGRNGE